MSKETQTEALLHNGQDVKTTFPVDISHVRDVIKFPLGDKYAVITVGNGLDDLTPDLKLTPEELLAFPDVMVKKQRSDIEEKLAEKAQKIADFVYVKINSQTQEGNDLNILIQKARDAELCNPQPDKFNSFSYRLTKPYPSFDKHISTDFVSINFLDTAKLKDALDALRADPKNPLSAHFIISEENQIVQLVDTNYRSYANGLGNFEKDSLWYPKFLQPAPDVFLNNLNSFAISIMVVKGADPDGSIESIRSLVDVLQEQQILPANEQLKVVGYDDWKGKIMAPQNRNCDWEKLALKNLGISPPREELEKKLKNFVKTEKEEGRLMPIDAEKPTTKEELKTLSAELSKVGYSDAKEGIEHRCLAAKKHFSSDIVYPGRNDANFEIMNQFDVEYLKCVVELLSGETLENQA